MTKSLRRQVKRSCLKQTSRYPHRGNASSEITLVCDVCLVQMRMLKYGTLLLSVFFDFNAKLCHVLNSTNSQTQRMPYYTNSLMASR